ncbi:hypothetical protein [Acinetobacter rongchengensis]|uniref:Uncharacterized protein n=1 Tax=Acinetobacter rongchengensis TaxID=2419601 RepID=A0A3A8EUY3_9GAMM|nr:hypothetical protein [Acinetobacter rongchengensis]RKG37969.1 hypothetical protein D7V20_09355 [Acinetobacter rongchengensis]
MNYKLNILLMSTILVCSGCQTVQKVSSGVTKTTDKVKSLVGLGETKAPEIDQQGVVDASKATLEKLEQMTLNMPTGQWVYVENDLQGIYTLQNKSTDGNMLYFRLNCKIPSQQSGFTIQDKDGKDLVKAHDPQTGQIQFLVDNKNYGNPFDLVNAKKMPAFKQALKTAKTIKIFNNSKLYTFENAHAELLNKPVTCRE